MKKVLKQLERVKFKFSKNEVINLFIIIAYYLIFAPGKLSVDSSILLEDIQKHNASSTGTAVYARYFQLLTINGNFLYLISLVNIISLYLGVKFFCQTYFANFSTFKNSFLPFFIFSPFFGFVGMTIGHETPFVSGTLILMSFAKKRLQFSHNEFLKLSNLIIILVGLVLCNCRFDGRYQVCSSRSKFSIRYN